MRKIRTRHVAEIANLVRVTKNPAAAWRGAQLGRYAIRSGALQKISEASPFFALIGSPSCVVEIGSAQGGMLAAFCAAADDNATIVSVDLEGGAYGSGVASEQLVAAARPKPGQTLLLVRGNSHSADIRDEVISLLPRPADVLFIDGDHTYDGVRADHQDYASLVASGGVIAFHDILAHPPELGCEVERYWNELDVRKREIVAPPKGWGGIGVIWVS